MPRKRLDWTVTVFYHLKAWQSKYFILRHSPPILDYYKDEISAHSPKAAKEKHSIILDENVVHIGPTDASRTHHHAFLIVTHKHGALTLASDTDKATKDWVTSLLKVVKLASSENQLQSFEGVEASGSEGEMEYAAMSSDTASPESSPRVGRVGIAARRDSYQQGFPVTVRFTPSAEKNQLRGSYVMRITARHVVLNKESVVNPVVSWPLTGLRGWKCDPDASPGAAGKQLLTLESGRKSLTGEGVFQFYTSHGDEIYELIRARSKALFANAVSKRNHFKPERSCSYEDLPSSDSPSVRLPRVNTMNEARLLSKRTSYECRKCWHLMEEKGKMVTSIKATINTIDESSSHMSPASVKRDLLKDETSSAKLLASTADSVFVEHRRNLSAVLELDKSKDEPLENTYLDLVVDDDTEPIHISGPRRISMASSTSESEKTPEHDNQGTERPAYVDERRRVTTAIPKEQSDGNKPDYAVREDKLEYSNQTYTDPGILREITPKDKPLSDAQKKLTDDFFAQLANPTAHQQTMFPSKPRSMTTPSPSTSPPKANRQPLKKKLSARKSNERGGVEKTRSKSEKVAPPKGHEAKVRTVKSESEAGKKNYAPEAGQQQTEMNKKIEVRPEEMEGILEKVLSQMETPLRQTTGKLVFTKPKRNSTGSLCTQSSEEKTNVDPCDKGDSLNVDYASKRQVEKSKSHSGIERASTQLNPPPLPVRPPLGGTPRTRGSASMGDIFEGINLRPDLGGMDRQKTFFAKGINMHHTSTPTGKNWPPLACGPESHHATRLLMRSNTAMQLPSEVIGSPPGSPRLDDPQRSRSSSLNRDEEERNFDEDDAKKRRGSKASKIIGRIFNSMSFSPRDERRGSNECGTTELEDLPKSRKASLTPGIVNEGWSPDNSADTSPSEGSPRLTVNLRASRRASHDGIPRYNPGSPPVNHNMREEQMRKAHARERERAELPDAHEPPPALPPRKHSDPPPLPPRRKKSHEDSPSPCTTPRRKSTELSRSGSDSCLSTSAQSSSHMSPASVKRDLLNDETSSAKLLASTADSVFVEHRRNLSAVLELDKSKDEPLENTYLDLVVDDDTEPIHISGPRRISMASSTSESEKTPEHDNQGTERPAYVDERRRVTTAIPKEQSDGNKPDYAVREDKLEYSNQTYTDPGILREITPKDKPLSDAQKKLTDDFFAQLANPTAHQQTMFPSKPRSMTTPSPSTSPPKANRQPLKKKLSARKSNERGGVEKTRSKSEKVAPPKGHEAKSTTAAPPTMSCAPNTNVPSPIPQRPPKSKELCTRQQHVDHGLVDDAAKLGRREVVGSNSGDKSSIEHEKAVGKHGKLLRQAELVEPSAFSSFERTSGHCRLDMARDEYTTALDISFPTGADYQNNNTSRQGGVGQRSTDSTRVSTLRSRSVSPHSSSLIPDGDPVARKYSAGNIEAASENFGKRSEMLGAGRNNAGRSSPVPLKMPSRGGGLVMSDSSPTSAISV
ncbi:predicted protein [Nematostella vectensis]|uniref:PH domain-containing protein n=1 Tax=Nematostella vectensis TaxID=45351 RepID=A7RF80_NEMVE|nr:predicted protein [Nematostella vectensis]|eukprot:XP_001641972.1 predicted protein [Nematostella vectensis]